jgi:hypothetical protein
MHSDIDDMSNNRVLSLINLKSSLGREVAFKQTHPFLFVTDLKVFLKEHDDDIEGVPQLSPT